MTRLLVHLTLFAACALLFSPCAMAQTEDCPRVWRVFEALHTDDAPRIQWLKAGQPDTVLLGATQSLFTPEGYGAYRVQVWGGVSAAFQWNPEAYPIERYIVFPNPFSTYFRVQTNALHPAKLEVFDLTGRKMLQAEVNNPLAEIDARSLPTGVYMVRITSYWGKEFNTKVIRAR